MDRQGELDIIRAAYARQVLAAAGVEDARLDTAFSAIRREDFLGPGPWPILRRLEGRAYVPTPDADPVYLYTNDLVGIIPERHINNGQPSLHAHLIHEASPAIGEHIVHVGTGTDQSLLRRLTIEQVTLEPARLVHGFDPLQRVISFSLRKSF